MDRRSVLVLPLLLGLGGLVVDGCGGKSRSPQPSPIAPVSTTSVTPSFIPPSPISSGTLASATVEIRVLSMAGNPLQGVLVQLRGIPGNKSTVTRTTSESGSATFGQGGLGECDFNGFALSPTGTASSRTVLDDCGGLPPETELTFEVVITTPYGTFLEAGPNGLGFTISESAPDLALSFTLE